MATRLTPESLPAAAERTEIAGKAVVITGGATGIGLATSELLARRGARVLLVGIDRKRVSQAVEEIGADVHGVVADVSKKAGVEKVFREVDKRLKGIDVLVNNAAIHGENFEDGDFETWRQMLEVNVLGYVACAKEAVKRMQKRGGHLVHVGSISAFQKEAGAEVYIATKAAVEAFNESVGKSLARSGIRTSVIEPGGVATPMVASVSKRRRDLGRDVRAKNLLHPTDIAECVYYIVTQPERCDVALVQIRPTGTWE